MSATHQVNGEQMRKLEGVTSLSKAQREQRATEASRNITEASRFFIADNLARRLAKAGGPVNADGLAVRNAPVRITTGAPVMSNGKTLLPGTDTSRIPAKAPSTGANEHSFVAVASTTIGSLRPGDLEHLAGHGVTVGLQAGIFTIKREFAPAAEGIIGQLRGGR